MTSRLHTRRDFLTTLAAGAAAAVVPGALSASSAGRDKPNIVFILVDDLGWTDLGCFGSKYYETPNIDKLCAAGMKFTNNYAACAVCSPTRAAVQTGRYPARVGITDFIPVKAVRTAASLPKPDEYLGGPNSPILCPASRYWMPHKEVTLAEVLTPAGYVCGHMGKWHLGRDEWHPETQGYAENLGGCDLGQPPSYFDPYVRKGVTWMQGIPKLPARKAGEYLTDRIGDEAAQFIGRHKGGRFYLNLCFYSVHTPIQGKPELVAKYKAKKATNQRNPTYAAMVQSVDEAVGRVAAALAEHGLADNTLVIFNSDNGGLLGPTRNDPLRAGKGHPYEGGIRVPGIVRWPAVVKPGATCDVPVISMDFFPTICDAIGAALPAGRTIDGESIMPLLKGGGTLKRDAIFWHFPHWRGRSIPPYSIIRQGSWKLIKRYAGRKFELFDLAKDLSEKIDLSEQLSEKTSQLDSRLTAWLKDTGAKLPKPNPAYGPRA